MTSQRSALPDEVVRALNEAARQRRLYDSAGSPMFEELSRVKAELERLRAESNTPFVVPFAVESEQPGPEGNATEYCAGLDHSDTDNGIRLKRHFGADLLVVAQEKAQRPFFAVWTGQTWDLAHGNTGALAIAQKLGDKIAEEVQYLKPTVDEQAALDAGANALRKPASERDPDEKRLADAAGEAKTSIDKRCKRRLDFAVSSKNLARLNAALTCVAPHILRSPDAFNADRMAFACRNATIRFLPVVGREGPATVRVDARGGHRREDLITHLVPVDYDPHAICPRWEAFLEKMQPEAEVRRLIQISSGLGLVGLTVQKLFFHYGDGANGKSVYMETLCRLLGDAAVTLPSTSLIGESGSSGGASPDLVRLYGRRLLRVKELPEGEDLKEALVKELTGGEKITARDLFAGYLDFEALFVAMMSGNGYPRISGTDNGIWRRMAVVHWPIKIPEEEQREFGEMLASFTDEYSGILNWLIKGVTMFLIEGLVIPEAVRNATQDYRDAMDRTSAFVAACIARDEAAPALQAKDLYEAYSQFTTREGGKPINPTAFGRTMAKKFRKENNGRLVVYYGIRLLDIPDDRPPPAQYQRFADDEPLPEDF